MKTRPNILATRIFPILMLAASVTFAAFPVTVTKSSDFDAGRIGNVAVVTVECHETVNCSNLEQRVIKELRRLKVKFTLVSEAKIRNFLFEKGATEYSEELRSAIAEHFEVDAFLNLKIPYAEKGAGFGGTERSKVKVELTLTRVDGGILLHGVGTGRPLNVVTSPERVAGNVVEAIARKAFKK